MKDRQNGTPSALYKNAVKILNEQGNFTAEQAEIIMKLLGTCYSYALKQARNELKQEEIELREKQIKAAKKLLKNYREIEAAVSSGVDHTVFVLDDTETERLMVREGSSKNEAARHKAITAATNKVLFLKIKAALEEMKKLSGDAYKPRERRYYDVLRLRYVLNWKPEAACAYLGNMSATNYYSLIQEATEAFSIILFGAMPPGLLP